MANQTVWAAYPTAVAVVVLFGLFAGIYTYFRHKKVGKDTTEFFLTARRSVGWWRIAWSFYAAAMGSWALFSPGSYAYYAGILGLAMYAFASGLPIILIAFLGGWIHKLVPNICSFTDFTNRRFGPVVQVYVACLMLFNMGVAMTAEFTAVGDMFAIVIGSIRWPIVVIIGIVSAAYTAYGGLYVSIITDQVQAFASLAMVAVLFIFVAATFRAPLPKPLTSDLSGLNFYGYSSIADMPISLFSATVFSEAMWQRCWATVDKRQLRLGATIGATAVTCVVFLFGFGGLLAAWSGLFVPSGPDDYGNTILFSLLDNVDGHRHTAIVVVVAVLSVTMSTSAIDSLQNALTDTISGVYLKRVRLIWVRLLVLALTVPCMIVSLKSYNIIQLFLLANLLTSTSTIPVLMGLWHTPLGLKVVTPFSMLSGCAQGIISIFWWAVIDKQAGETYSQALHRLWVVEYQYQDFLIAPAMSVVGLLAGAALEYVFRRATGWQYDLSNPFKQDDVMPVDVAPAAGKLVGEETESSEGDDFQKPEKL